MLNVILNVVVNVSSLDYNLFNYYAKVIIMVIKKTNVMAVTSCYDYYSN